MAKYRVIKLEHRYSSYIVEAETVEEAVDKGDLGHYLEVVYEDDPGDYGVVEVIEVDNSYTGGNYDITAEYDGDIVFQEWF